MNEIPKKMRAVQYDAFGSPEVLVVRTVDVPKLKSGHALVKVAATSVNGADLHFRSGELSLLSGKKFPKGVGFDFTGEVVAVDPSVSELHVGDLVWGFITAKELGAAAEYVLASTSQLAIRPKSIDPISAAALPGVAGMLEVLRDKAKLKSGERILIRGASGAAGSIAIGIAKHLGARITALVREKQISQALALGADEALDYRSLNPDTLGTFDVILDPVAKDMPSFRKHLTRNGRMYALYFGDWKGILSILLSLIHGSRRIRLFQTIPKRDLLQAMTQLVDTGSLKPVIDSTYSMDDIAAAHSAMERGGGFGKRVVRIE